MKKIYLPVVTLLTVLIAFARVPGALAHPLGNFTINQYIGLHISRELVLVDYVLDMAEIPAFQELAPFDSDNDRQPDLPALQNYPADKCTSLLAGLNLTLANRRATLTLASSAIEFPVGVGGLPTIRLTCEFQSPVDNSQGQVGLLFMNNNFADRLGWREIVVSAEGVSLEGDFATVSSSHRLTTYPQDLLNSPLDQRRAEIGILFAESSLPASSSPSAKPEPSKTVTDRNDPFTRLILLEELTLPGFLLALGISLVWGAMHAMTPGHGKTIVGAYLVGSRGTMRHAVYLGLTTTITHTLGVFLLGLITLFAAQYILPETLFPWLSLFSGLFVVGIGLNLFAQRFKSLGRNGWRGRFKTSPVPAPGSSMPGANAQGSHRQHRYVLAAAHHHTHAHSYHSQNNHHHAHEHGQQHDQSQHPHAYHSHTPPQEMTWRSLLALGVSGGLIPCPSALVVMLGAIALNRIGFGLMLVLAFSLGLAGALTMIGILFIYAGKLLNKFPSSGKITRLVPVFSALFISLIGFGIVYRALLEVGIA